MERNHQAQLDTRAYAREVDRLKATLHEIVATARLDVDDRSPDTAAGDRSVAARQQRIILATRQYRNDLRRAVDRSIAHVTRLRQQAERRQEKHNLALAMFDEKYAAHVEGLEAEIDRLAITIAAASWERKQQSGTRQRR